MNADLIAAGLSPFDPSGAAVRAARLMIAEIRRHLAAREGFALETTLAGLGYARSIPRWQRLGYRVELIFLGLADVEIALARIRARVAQGGHDVSEEVVRRFIQGRDNLESVYAYLVDSLRIYDNSGGTPVLTKAEPLL